MHQEQQRRYVPVQLAAVKGCPKDLLRPEQLANLRALTCYGLGAILQHLSTWESFPESFQVMLLWVCHHDSVAQRLTSHSAAHVCHSSHAEMASKLGTGVELCKAEQDSEAGCTAAPQSCRSRRQTTLGH